MSIGKRGGRQDSNGPTNAHGMQYYQAAAQGQAQAGVQYGYYYDMGQGYQQGEGNGPPSPNEVGGFPQGESQDAQSQGSYGAGSPVFVQQQQQRFPPTFQQGRDFQGFGGERQAVFGTPQNAQFQYAQGGAYHDPNQHMTSMGPQSSPFVSSANADVIARANMMGHGMSASMTMPMLAAGGYPMGMNRGGIPMVSVNDQNFAQMIPRGGVMSWADVAKVASENHVAVSAAMSPMSQVMQPKVLSPGQPFALAPAALPPMFALNAQPRFVPGTLPVYGQRYPPQFQFVTLTSQSYPGRPGRGFKGFAPGRGRGFGAPGRGGFEQRYESGNERGPRAQRAKFGQLSPGGSEDEIILPGGLGREQFNREDFDVAPPVAKFFVIKSYSEDDVHKSIKYGVWASTPNGNKRLQATWRDAAAAAATENGAAQELTRIFLLFSVNASGQFCGVAEMKGDVDFDKSLDVWQQDKWNGQFDVQWHFVKDVPNGQFRHIILANNEDKPVTNSRDTQEVPYDQGLEVLQIFKAYAAKTSILDDFPFYDHRQKQLQERRERSKQGRNTRRQRAAAETHGEEDASNTDHSEPAGDSGAQEEPHTPEEESLGGRLADLSLSQDESEL